MSGGGIIEQGRTLDPKFWLQAKKTDARPLRLLSHKALADADIYETVRRNQGFETRGEARDLVGAELRERLRESGHG